MMKRSTILTRNKFVEVARSYLGVPFRHQGRDRRGVDCLGLLVCIARDLEIDYHDSLNYSRSPDYRRMRDGMNEHFKTVRFDDALIGDVYWIKWKRMAYPMHLAINAGGGQVIHADGQCAKKVTEHAMPMQWRELIVRTLRLRIWP